MTHKHFELIASALRNTRPTGELNAARVQWWDTVDQFVRECTAANPRFNRDRFIAACTKEG